ncbi:toll/interleukin-1 receptor domain-containing protein [Vitreimonas flagellata]|uniref:toll/interleukin-1 receptor domain-containing protein n=1 Tax=Vitreimonas flagellata TaxID=2560861 RepID=UPI00142FC246|nr:toll/interleukin-1 receptor domain-containing protein [Vitreimonas flagellata]
MPYRYAAFISYSSIDAAFAKRLHRTLEVYQVPKSLGQVRITEGGKSNRIYPVFRDREELAAGQLSEGIEASLRASSALIVVCSSAAAASQWVQKEIEYFKTLPQGGRIFSIIAETVPADEAGKDRTRACLPVALGPEPLAADARSGKDGFRYALLKLIAGIINVSPGVLRDRDKAQRQRSLVQRVLLGVAVGFFVLTGLSTVAELGRRSDLARRGEAFAALSPVAAVLRAEPDGANLAAGDIVRGAALLRTSAEISATGFSEDERFAVIGLSDGSLLRFASETREMAPISWTRACNDKADTIWNECAVFAVAVSGDRIASADADGNVAAFDRDGALLAQHPMHDSAIVGLTLLPGARNHLISADIQGEMAVLSWPDLRPLRRIDAGCRVTDLRARDGDSVLVDCADGRGLIVQAMDGAVIAIPPERRSLGAFQLSDVVENDDRARLRAHFPAPASGLERILAQSDRAVVAIGEEGPMIFYAERWMRAPFVEEWSYDGRGIELSPGGRFVVLSARGQTRHGVIDLVEYAEMDMLLASSSHVRQDVCRSRWADALPSATQDLCARRGLLSPAGWMQAPQSFADLWRR